jgi:hypothetical protein
MATIDLHEIRSRPGGERLSPETAMLLALVVFDGFTLFPSAAERAATNPYPHVAAHSKSTEIAPRFSGKLPAGVVHCDHGPARSTADALDPQGGAGEMVQPGEYRSAPRETLHTG